MYESRAHPGAEGLVALNEKILTPFINWKINLTTQASTTSYQLDNWCPQSLTKGNHKPDLAHCQWSTGYPTLLGCHVKLVVAMQHHVMCRECHKCAVEGYEPGVTPVTRGGG